jgi:hypothetical protein
MKRFSLLTTFLLSLPMYVCSFVLADHEILRGRQPTVSVDPKGVIRMAYGFQDSIYCVTSTNQGQTFSQPVLVAALPAMHLGMSRGPQLASSSNYSMVTAIDKQGTIHTYLLDHHLPGWKEMPPVNDVPGSAVEGLMNLTAAADDWFYAVWLDIRQEQKNNIYTAAFHSRSSAWGTNQLVYRSPEGKVCECCRPTIFYGDSKLVITFRNALDGARDIYFAVSTDRGKHFGSAAKMGKGSWLLNACPMDGGDVMLNDKGQVVAAWRRGSEFFYSVEGQQEQKSVLVRPLPWYGLLENLLWPGRKITGSNGLFLLVGVSLPKS